MTTKLNLSDQVTIEGRRHIITKIYIDKRGIIYQVTGVVRSPHFKHMCNDQFWEVDYDAGHVLKL